MMIVDDSYIIGKLTVEQMKTSCYIDTNYNWDAIWLQSTKKCFEINHIYFKVSFRCGNSWTSKYPLFLFITMRMELTGLKKEITLF